MGTILSKEIFFLYEGIGMKARIFHNTMLGVSALLHGVPIASIPSYAMTDLLTEAGVDPADTLEPGEVDYALAPFMIYVPRAANEVKDLNDFSFGISADTLSDSKTSWDSLLLTRIAAGLHPINDPMEVIIARSKPNLLLEA